MYPHWNPNINQQYVYSPHPARNTLHHDSQYMMRRIASLENQLTKLISLIEENNQLIKSMEQQKPSLCTSWRFCYRSYVMRMQ